MMESGDILDVLEQESDGTLYGCLVIDPYLPCPDLTGSYSHGGIDCPVCDGNRTCVIKLPYWAMPITDVEFRIIPNNPSVEWYCQDCNLVWRSFQIGVKDATAED